MNTIASVKAILVDGSVVTFDDADPSHKARLRYILDNDPVDFSVTMSDGSVFGVDLATGNLYVGDGYFALDEVPQAPLRLIYFKRMYADVGESLSSALDFFVVGWQSTYKGKNHKIGLKVSPRTYSFDVTGEF